MQPLKTLNCEVGRNKNQHVLQHAHNLPVVRSIKKVVVLCGANRLNQDLLKDITDGIIEVGILLRNYNWSIN